MLKRFRPLLDRVLIERVAAETKSKGGILLPEKALGKVLEGKVIACGPGRRNDKGDIIPPNVNVGDHVLLPEFGGTKIELEEKEYHLFRDNELLAKFSD